MGLLTSIFGLPLAPVRGVVALARTLQEQAEREVGDRSRIRRALEDAEMAVRSGQISAEEADEARKQILRPVVTERPPAPRTGPSQ